MEHLVDGVFVLPRWLAPWRIWRQAPSTALERPAETKPGKSPINEFMLERVWEDYFLPTLRDRDLTKGEILRAKGLFVNTILGKMVRTGDIRKSLEYAEEAIRPYIKARTRAGYVEKCDFCGRPHVDSSSQCPGCGVWRKQYR